MATEIAHHIAAQFGVTTTYTEPAELQQTNKKHAIGKVSYMLYQAQLIILHWVSSDYL